MLKVGNKPPKFNLPDQNGNLHSLDDYLGKWLLIYFYPRDNTPGCTKEACSIRDVYQEYNEAEIKVLGISADSTDSHQKFVKKYSLPFTLLSDKDKGMVKAYGVLKKKNTFGKEYLGIIRASFLINPSGKIEKIYPKVKPEEHATEVLLDVKNLKI